MVFLPLKLIVHVLENFYHIAHVILNFFSCFVLLVVMFFFCACFCLSIYMFLCYYVKPQVFTVESNCRFAFTEFCIWLKLTYVTLTNQNIHTIFVNQLEIKLTYLASRYKAVFPCKVSSASSLVICMFTILSHTRYRLFFPRHLFPALQWHTLYYL